MFELSDDLQKIASAGIEAVLTGPAAALPRAVDLGRHRRVLDVGGGSGSVRARQAAQERSRSRVDPVMSVNVMGWAHVVGDAPGDTGSLRGLR